MSPTPAQTDALGQLWAITASTTDAARARDERVLREHSWDVEVSCPAVPGETTRETPSDGGLRLTTQLAVNHIFSGGATQGSRDTAGAGGSAAPSARKTETEGSAAAEDLGDLAVRSGVPLGPRRISGTTTPRPRPGQAGLGVWDTFVWPFSFIASILTGTWYFFSESGRVQWRQW